LFIDVAPQLPSVFRGRDSCFGGAFITHYRQERQVRNVGVTLFAMPKRLGRFVITHLVVVALARQKG
jgi:hypothetical protein